MKNGLIVLPEAELVDALGAPLRSEPEPTETYANAEHAELTLEALEAAVCALLPPPSPPPDPYAFRMGPIMSVMPICPFVIHDVLDEPSAAATDQAGPEPAEGKPDA